MVYCRKCGKEIDPNAYLCIHCGASTHSGKRLTDNANAGMLLGKIGLFFAFFYPPVGVVLNIRGLSQAIKAENHKGVKLNQKALIISILTSILYFIIFLLIFL